MLVGTADGVAPGLPDTTAHAVVVANKVDLAAMPAWAGFGVSATTGQGLAGLRTALEGIAADLTGAAEAPPLTRLRHRRALERAAAALGAAGCAPMAELCGEDLRVALFALGTLLGHSGVEDVLDAIFGEFCIGK